MSSKYNLGDKVYLVDQRRTDRDTVCPDCAGKRYLTVVMGDDSRVTIPCTGCSSGYGDPTGLVHYYQFEARVLHMEVTSVKKGDTGYEYEIQTYGCGYYPRIESELFTTREAADEYAKELVAKNNQKELDDIKTKHKDHRSWAWNATYHRNCIKQAEKQIAYHSARLDWANQVKKAEKV